MIRVNVAETFPITVSLIDEITGSVATGKTVYYDVRQYLTDLPIFPPASGILSESTVEPGIYTGIESINKSGTYIVYATCSGFLSNTEEIIISSNYSRHYNTSIEDVVRTTVTPTPSQVVRNVGLGKTDYIITRLKPDHVSDWTGPSTVSGSVYAHYKEFDDETPFLMGGSGV